MMGEREMAQAARDGMANECETSIDEFLYDKVELLWKTGHDLGEISVMLGVEILVVADIVIHMESREKHTPL